MRFPKGVIMHMVGIARVRLSGGCYEPDEAGAWAYISPARVAGSCDWCDACQMDPLYGCDHPLGPERCPYHTIPAAVLNPYTDWRYPWAVLGGELVDLICWDTDTPHAWASRCGVAEWLGCASRDDPTPIRRSPVDWLRNSCSGLVLLTQDRVRQYEILSECNDIVAADDYHADALNALLAYPYPRKAVFVA
jgi:hypothetical protein